MSFFSNLFRKSPAKLVARAERCMASGNYPDAIEDLNEVIEDRKNEDPAATEKARALLPQACEGLAALNLEEAEFCLNAGDSERAGEHIELALKYLPESREARRLQKRLDRLQRGRGGGGGGGAAFLGPAGRPPPQVDEAPQESDDNRWEVLLFTYREDLVETYKERGTMWRNALFALQDGDAGAAMNMLDIWLGQNEGDAYGHLERGRARLLADNLDGAVEDFDAYQAAKGWEAVDEAGHLHVGRLLGEALIRKQRFEEAATRMGEAAEAEPEDVALRILRGQALVGAKNLDEAEPWMTETVQRFPKVVDGFLVLAQVYRARKDNDRAIEALEAGVQPNCEAPGCSAGAFHVEAYRSLASLYLDEARDSERVDQILRLLFTRLGEQRVRWVDHLLMARLCRQTGRLEAMAEARERALAGAGENKQIRALIETQLAA